MNRRSFTAAILGSGLLASALLGTTAIAADKPPIKIGADLPLSGFQKAYGEMYKTAALIAVDEINKAGGVNGSPLQLIVDDDQGLPNESVLLFRRHVADGVFVHVGPISGTTWESVAPLANAMKVPSLNFTALKPGLSKLPYALATHPSDAVMVPQGVAEFVKKFPNVKKVVVTGDVKEASGAAGMAEFEKAAKANNLQVIETVPFDTKTTDFSPVAIKIRGLAPDAVFASAFGPNALALLKEMDVQGSKTPVLVNALIWPGSFVQTVGAGAERVYTIGWNTNEPAPSQPGHDAFTKRFAEEAEKSTSLPKPINVANAGMAYDAVMLLAGIMKEKGIDGSTDLTKARESITEGMGAMKSFSGLNKITMQAPGVAEISSHLLEVDVPGKTWKYVLKQ